MFSLAPDFSRGSMMRHAQRTVSTVLSSARPVEGVERRSLGVEGRRA